MPKSRITTPMLVLSLSVALITSHSVIAKEPKTETAQRFKAHMDFLASDLLEGRDTGSHGHEVAAQYIASEFAKLGIVPAGTEGYQQRIEFKSAVLDKESPEMTLHKGNKSVELSFLDDFLVSADVNRQASSVTGDLVFAGFGIDAPFLQYDDFQGVDIEGKIAVVLSGKPNHFPSEEGAHYSRTSVQAMVDRGAIGVITVRTPVAEKVRPFAKGKDYIHRPRIKAVDEHGEVVKGLAEIQAGAALSMEASQQLFDLAGIDLQHIYAQIEQGKKPKGQPMGLTASISYQSTHSSVTSPNVVGILEGSDPQLKDEYVLLSAHTDHLGISHHIELGDKINNGAMDNAAGVSTLLEMAHTISQSPERPKRSILFVMVTAEEKGLLGSEYFANNPTVPIGSIVANVNLDMPVLTNAFDQLVGFGAQHSNLWGVIETAVSKHNMTLIPDPMPEQSIFVRSDQYSFVKQGIPAVYLVTADNAGMKFEEHELSSQDFLLEHYHQPSDQLDLPINYQVAAVFVSINEAIVMAVANNPERPKWNPDSFFATIATH